MISSLRRLGSRIRDTVDRLTRAAPTAGSTPVCAAVRTRPLALFIAVTSGVAVYVIATTVFPYHSSNDDEAVYLLQAAMLLEGQLELFAGELAPMVRPWFFVEDGGRLYPKYAPVPAAFYAVSMALFGEPRATLAAVAAVNTGLVYLLGRMVFDRRVGIVAAVVFAASPLGLLASAVFLPYAPTTMLNLAFAVCYLRGIRDRHLPSAAAAGIAVGTAFFARPFTAALFAAPFVAHALWTGWRSIRASGLHPPLEPVVRNGITAVGGLLLVGVTLAYNARLTGSPFLFPYEAFAPLDGPGFGHRRLLDHSIEYTPRLAVRANTHVLWYFATRWFTAGIIGTIAAAAGLALALRRRRYAPGSDSVERPGVPLLAGVLVTVSLGNVAFWGNRNILATMDDPTTGLLSLFGPVYHFDMLAPLAVFAAFALVSAWDGVRTRTGVQPGTTAASSPRNHRPAVAALIVVVLVGAAVNAALLAGPLDRHGANTAQFEAAYEPFHAQPIDNGVVFLPTPYGQWQQHPFQYLRNEPDLAGSAVYAGPSGPDETFTLIDAYPDRSYYRYSYRGTWTPDPADPITATLERLTIRRAEAVDGVTVVGVPDGVVRATIRLEGGQGDYTTRAVVEPTDEVRAEWSIDGDRATLAESAGSVPIDGADEVALLVTLVQFDGGTLTYRQEMRVRTIRNGVELVWPPVRKVCWLATDCDTSGTYLPDDPDAHPEWVTFETRLTDRS